MGEYTLLTLEKPNGQLCVSLDSRSLDKWIKRYHHHHIIIIFV